MADVIPLAAVVGHDGPVGRLREALASGRLAHGYLLHGPSGVGKGTVALGMAQALFCHRGDGCGVCPGCIKLARGSHPDLFQVGVPEGKTQIPVDAIREVAQFLSLTAMEGRWKVAIIDDAALLNIASANALLKTLEEPTPNTLLLLVTSRPGALLATIRSRCQKVRLEPLAEEAVATVLARVAPEVPAAQRRQAAALAEGSVSRGLDLCQGELLAWREELARDLAGVDVRRLADLIGSAERWSGPDRFPHVIPLFQAWLRDQIHDSVTRGERAASANLLEVAQWSEQIIRRAQIFNLNRQLLLEALFIRVAGLR